MRIKKLLRKCPLCYSIAVTTACMLIVLVGCAKQERLIGIATIVEHSSLNAVRDGFVNTFTDQGLESDYRFEFQSAEGRPTNAVTILNSFVSKRAVLILAITTPIAQIALPIAEREHIPVVFAAVTDPEGAGLVSDVKRPGGWITGVSDKNPIERTIEIILEVLPSVRSVGILYNPGESNSVYLVKHGKSYAESRGIKVVDGIATSSAGVQAALTSILPKADCIIAPTDNTIFSAIDVVMKECVRNKMPLFGSEEESVKRGGAVASIFVDYTELGRKAGGIAIDILEKETKVGDNPVQFPEELDLMINTARAQSLGIAIPDSIIKRASKVYSETEEF